MSIDVLIVEDESEIAELMSDALIDEKFSTRIAKNSIEAFNYVDQKVPNVIILDIWLQNSPLDGLGILEKIKEVYPLLPVIMISGHGTIANVVHAIKVGAYDYITKPFSQDKLILTVKRAYEHAQLKKSNKNLQIKAQESTNIVGSSEEINKLKLQITKIAKSSGSVLIIGDTGTEKAAVARMIHDASSKKGRPLLTLQTNFTSTREIEKKLFGQQKEHDKTSMIPKLQDSLLKQGNDGTVYISKLSQLSLEIQNKLLQFIQTGFLENFDQKVNTRIIISASEAEIQNLTQNKELNNNLYSKLLSNKIKIPSIRSRKQDIQEILQYWISIICEELQTTPITLDNQLINIFKEYKWQCNIEEIKNTIHWIILNADLYNLQDRHITEQKFIYMIENNEPVISKILNKIKYQSFSTNQDNSTNSINMSLPLKEARAEFEKQYLSKQMEKMGYNVSQTAQSIGMERSALHRKLVALGISTSKKQQ